MPKYSGENVHVEWRDASGTILLSAMRTSFETNWSADTIETTSGAATYREYLAGLGDFAATWQGFYLGTAAPFGTAALARLAPRSAGTLVWGEHGSVTGQPKRGFEVVITAHNLTMPFGDAAITLALEFQGTGAPVFNYGAVWP